MILHCDTLRLPLRHSGTQQRDRLLLTLVPGQLVLDDRSMEELLAFAGKLSKHVRYWNTENEAAGDWLPFWESDATSLLAIIASIDAEGMRVGYRSMELKYYALKKKEEQGVAPVNGETSAAAINELVKNADFGVYGLAVAITEICKKLPPNHPLKTELTNIIISTLREPLKKLIRFHKAIDREAIKKYSAFIGSEGCALPWGLPDNASFECLDFVMPYEHVDEIWKLFLLFYKTLTTILAKVKRAFQSSIRSRHNHQPQITLFIAFLELFKHLQDDLNSLTGKHLLFYYHDILRLEKRRLIPDKVHIVFEIAANIVRHRIAKDTELLAGADSAGNLMSYRLPEELVISSARLVERKNLYFFEERDPQDKVRKIISVALPAADKRDGIDEEWPEGFKAWHPLSGLAVRDRLLYKVQKLEQFVNRLDGHPLPKALTDDLEKYGSKLEKLNNFSGFSISSYEMWLTKGFARVISFQLAFTNNETDSLLDLFDVELATEEGLIRLKPHFAELDNNLEDPQTGLPESAQILLRLFGTAKDDDENDTIHEQQNRIIKLTGIQRYLVLLRPDFPSVKPLNEGEPPFLRFKSSKPESSNLSLITSVSIFSYSEGVASSLKKSRAGLFFRDLNDGVEAGDELVVTAAGNQSVAVRFPEVFGKDFKYLNFSLTGELSNPVAAVLLNGQWINVPADGQVPAHAFANPGTVPVVPELFFFKAIPRNPDGWLRLTFDALDDIPVVLSADEFQIQYRSAVTLIRPGEQESARHFLSYFTSLGEWMADESALRAVPNIEQPQLKPALNDILIEKYLNEPRISRPANGNLFLGFADLLPGQTLSLLFQMAEGTGNPDHYAPEVKWSYLRNDFWEEFPPHFILRDTTTGLRQTGIILFQIPTDINNGNKWIKGKDNNTSLYWLRASAEEIPADLVVLDALPMLKDIFVHAAEAVFIDDHNTEDHLEQGLPAARISELRYSDKSVQTITQPFASFGGRRSEKSDVQSYIKRANERIRHKHRAVTIWDYERIILEAFTKAPVVKCLSHTRRLSTARPGHVTVAAIPFPEKMTGNTIYYPIFSAGDLAAMKAHLVKRNSYFVGRYGDPAFCCCDDGCACEHHDRLDVINARFEPVRIKVCVRFYAGRDQNFYKKELNEALKSFLAPWAKENKPLLFGVSISVTRLLQFLEELEYVDAVMSLETKHFSSREMSDNFESNIPFTKAAEIVPFTAASVITTYLDKLNEDNPNVIDHVINVVQGEGRCNCDGCLEDQQPAPPENPNAAEIENLQNTFRELWIQHPNVDQAIRNFIRVLDEKTDNGVLKGAKPPNPKDAEQGVHAYKIEKKKIANRIRSVIIGLSFDTQKPFDSFEAFNPNNNQ